MNKTLYIVRWQQEYHNWPEMDLTEARKVLARIMAL
jgi:predicted Fe-S protein YdhL (DUF1289 family)